MNLGHFAGVFAWVAFVALPTHAQVKIGVITSATGPTSFVGVPQKNSVALLPREVGGTPIEYLYLDDASDALEATKELVATQGSTR